MTKVVYIGRSRSAEARESQVWSTHHAVDMESLK